MGWAALIVWITTAAGGLVLGGQWWRHGGTRQSSGIRPTRLATHVLLAVIGLSLWLAFLLADVSLLGVLAMVLLGGVIAVGVSMLLIWLRGRSGREATELPAETAFPLPLVLLHGVLGLTTLALGLLALLGT